MKTNSFQHETGFCAACGTVHVNEESFDDNRTCRNCGEDLVYNLNEYRDILIDWKRLKVEFDLLAYEMDDGK